MGTRLGGPLLATQAIHHWIETHPSATRAEIMAAVLATGMVDRGYAHREYAVYLNKLRTRSKKASAQSRQEETPASIMATRSDHAVQFVARKVLAKMKFDRSITLNDDGRYTVRRPLKKTTGLTKEQVISDPAHTRRELALREALRAVGLERPKFDNPQSKISTRTKRLIGILYDTWMRSLTSPVNGHAAVVVPGASPEDRVAGTKSTNQTK